MNTKLYGPRAKRKDPINTHTGATPMTDPNDLDATAETPITVAALDDLASDAVDITLLAQDLKRKIEALRRKLAPTEADAESGDDESQPRSLLFG
jgi:hypothetical protein